eukprot:367518_1
MSLTPTSSHAWNKLKAYPALRNCSYMNVLVLNPNKLLLISYLNKSIWQYHINENIWTKWMNCVEMYNKVNIRFHTSAFNNNKTMLYIFGEGGQIVSIDMKTKHFIVSNNKYHDGSFSRSLFINNKLHLFGGYNPNDKSHFIWDIKQNKLDKSHQFNEIKHKRILTDPSVMHLLSKQSVIIMPEYSDCAYLYSLQTNNCIKIYSNEKDDNGFERAIVTKNEKFVIRFMADQEIFILDLNTMKLLRSAIRTPVSSYIRCIFLRHQNDKEHLVTFGFVRKCWNLSEFESILYPPFYIIKIIQSYISFAMVHVFYNGRTHFCIDLDEIFNNYNAVDSTIVS